MSNRAKTRFKTYATATRDIALLYITVSQKMNKYFEKKITDNSATSAILELFIKSSHYHIHYKHNGVAMPNLPLIINKKFDYPSIIATTKMYATHLLGSNPKIEVYKLFTYIDELIALSKFKKDKVLELVFIKFKSDNKDKNQKLESQQVQKLIDYIESKDLLIPYEEKIAYLLSKNESEKDSYIKKYVKEIDIYHFSQVSLNIKKKSSEALEPTNEQVDASHSNDEEDTKEETRLNQDSLSLIQLFSNLPMHYHISLTSRDNQNQGTKNTTITKEDKKSDEEILQTLQKNIQALTQINQFSKIPLLLNLDNSFYINRLEPVNINKVKTKINNEKEHFKTLRVSKKVKKVILVIFLITLVLCGLFFLFDLGIINNPLKPNERVNEKIEQPSSEQNKTKIKKVKTLNSVKIFIDLKDFSDSVTLKKTLIEKISDTEIAIKFNKIKIVYKLGDIVDTQFRIDGIYDKEFSLEDIHTYQTFRITY